MFDFEEGYFYPAKDGIDTIIQEEDIALFGEMEALKLIACPLPGLRFSPKGMNWSQMEQVYSSMKAL